MPKYSKSNIKYIIYKEQFSKLYRNAQKTRDKAWITILWLTGAGPEEILQLQKKNIEITTDYTSFHIITKKLPFQKKDKFIIQKRKLNIKIPQHNQYIKNLNQHLSKFTTEQRIFQFSKRTGNNIIERISQTALGENLCPYNFRHSRLTILAEQGHTKDYLKKFKGSRSDQSVTPYLHARQIEYDVEAEI